MRWGVGQTVAVVAAALVITVGAVLAIGVPQVPVRAANGTDLRQIASRNVALDFTFEPPARGTWQAVGHSAGAGGRWLFQTKPDAAHPTAPYYAAVTTDRGMPVGVGLPMARCRLDGDAARCSDHHNRGFRVDLQDAVATPVGAPAVAEQPENDTDRCGDVTVTARGDVVDIRIGSSSQVIRRTNPGDIFSGDWECAGISRTGFAVAVADGRSDAGNSAATGQRPALTGKVVVVPFDAHQAAWYAPDDTRLVDGYLVRDGYSQHDGRLVPVTIFAGPIVP